MGLKSVGACFLPYGFERQSDGTWVAFNREYFPLFVSVKARFTKKKLDGLRLFSVRRDEQGEMYLFFLYEGDPWESKRLLRAYYDRLEALVTVATADADQGLGAWQNHFRHHHSLLKWNTLGRPPELAPPPARPPPRRLHDD